MPRTDYKPELVTKERAEEAALKFHQICLGSYLEAESFESAKKIGARDSKLVAKFLKDCCNLLPTQEQMENARSRT